jgi:hypothetical protein
MGWAAFWAIISKTHLVTLGRSDILLKDATWKARTSICMPASICLCRVGSRKNDIDQASNCQEYVVGHSALIQGDQIERIFAQCVIVFFGQLSKNYTSGPYFRATLLHDKGYASILTFGLHFGV